MSEFLKKLLREIEQLNGRDWRNCIFDYERLSKKIEKIVFLERNEGLSTSTSSSKSARHINYIRKAYDRFWLVMHAEVGRINNFIRTKEHECWNLFNGLQVDYYSPNAQH